MPTILLVTVAEPSGGIGLCRVTRCSPWTSIAGLNVPTERMTPPPAGITTGNVGKTCWSTPAVFSVVKASSSPPAPMPTA